MAKAADNERKVLKRFLLGFYKARNRQKALRERRLKIRAETFRDHSAALAEIDAKISSQQLEAEKTALQIMAVIDYLPPNSIEREIVEHRHIDCKTWAQVQKAVFLTPSPCFERYGKALDALLAIAAVREIIGLPPIERS